MELQKLTERWNYICGGFWYIDEHQMADQADTLGLTAAELAAFLQSLTPGHEEQVREITAALGLDREPKAFDPLPKSFEIMLRCDQSWLETAPETPLDPEFGSVAMAVLGREIAELLEAKENISWSMPTFWQGRNILHFAAAKHHIGLYPGAEAVEHFSEQLDKKGYRHSKGAIQIPYSGELPLELIAGIAAWCLDTGSHV